MERSTLTTAVFRGPFRLGGFDEELPPGSYEIETVEEQMSGLTFSAFRRVSTTMTVRDPATGMRQVTEIDPGELAAALAADAAI